MALQGRLSYVVAPSRPLRAGANEPAGREESVGFRRPLAPGDQRHEDRQAVREQLPEPRVRELWRSEDVGHPLPIREGIDGRDAKALRAGDQVLDAASPVDDEAEALDGGAAKALRPRLPSVVKVIPKRVCRGRSVAARDQRRRELVPRLGLGLVAAAASLWWCALVIDVADAVSGFVAAELSVTAGDMLRSTLRTLLTAVAAGSVGMALVLALLYLVYGFFVLYLVVQMVLRLALIDILLALAPIALGLWILPHTAGWGRHWLRLFMTTVFQQAIQLIALALGIGFLNEYAAIGWERYSDLAPYLLQAGSVTSEPA